MVSPNTIIKRYSQWITEQRLIEADQPAAPSDLSKEVKFNFNFESGKWLASEIPDDQLAKLKLELNRPISLLRTPRYLNQKTILTLIASTSTLGLTPDLKTKLQQAGFKSTGNGNDALCAARLKTLEDIVITYFCEQLKCTPDELRARVQIKKIAKPNSGGGESDEVRKQFQYIAMQLNQTGQEIPTGGSITCNMQPSRRSGSKATRETNYVGYNADQVIVVPVGNNIKIKLNPLTVPDMVYLKYKGREFLSPWIGAKTSELTNGQTRNFESELNDPTKCPGLKDAINAEIKKLGGNLTVETALAKSGGYVNDKFVVLPGPAQNGNPNNFTFSMTKGFDVDNLTIRVFAPLEGTLFTIESGCTQTVQNKKVQQK